MRRTALVMMWAAVMGAGAERAGYDSRGHLIALLSAEGEVEALSDFVAVLPNGRRVPLKDRRVGSPARNQSQVKEWGGEFSLPDGGRVRLAWRTRDGADGLAYEAEGELLGAAVERVEFVLDVARGGMAGGRLAVDGREAAALTAARGKGAELFRGRMKSVELRREGRLTVAFAEAREAAVLDRWDVKGDVIRTRMPLEEGGQTGTMYLAHSARSYQVRVPLVGPGETKGSLRMRLAFEGAVDTAPARLTLDAGRARYSFDGFGGNLCWDNGKGNRAVQKYVFENLQHGWARTEMKLQAWDAAGRQASGDVRFDLETMQRLQRMGIPYVISVWRLPERFYVDAYERPRGDRFRVIDGAKWDELNEFIGGYLQYAKKEFGVEPDLFSFNEPNIGVQVGQTPEQHTEQIRKMGAAFRRMGLKTKMLLADAVPARDSHVFALDAANDAEALQYVGAVGFHSWGGATAKQYAAWGDLAEWLGVPLLVTELGVDSQAFATNSWDSYHYGIREAQMTQEILLHARPRGTQFWQYTDDFALAKLQADGTAAPTARFWLMKHFTDLTPLRSEALGTASDQAGVLFTAFRTGERYAMHVVNRGGGREARIAGVPAGRWQVTETTEGAAFVKKGAVPGGGEVVLRLPARSVVTLVRE